MIKSNKIQAKLRLLGGLFTGMLAILFISVLFMNYQQKKDSYIVNIAGYQRMLTQKMTKEVLYISYNSSNDFRELNWALNYFEVNLNDLINSNELKGINAPSNSEIKNQLLKVKQEFIPFKKEILQIENMQNLIVKSLEKSNAYIDLLSTIELKLSSLKASKNKTNSPNSLIDKIYFDLSFLSHQLKNFAKDNYALDFGFIMKNAQKINTNLQNLKSIYIEDIDKIIIEQILKHWEEIKTYIDELNKNVYKLKHSVEYIFYNNSKILIDMDEAVNLYTKASENKNQNFLNMIYIIIFICSCVTIYLYLLTKDMILHIDSFVAKMRSITKHSDSDMVKETFSEDHHEEELNQASLYIADYIKKVHTTMRHSNDTIHKAKEVANELQNLALEVENVMKNLNIDENEKKQLNKKVSDAEDIAIESTENLIYVSKMLTRLQENLKQMIKKSTNNL